MADKEDLRSAMRELKRRTRRAIAAAQPSARRVDVAGRVNAVVVTHTGEDGTVTSATAHQSAPIHQGGTSREGETSR